MSIREEHYGASGKLFEYGRANRKSSTPAEQKLWHCLRNRKLAGFKFRRQHPLRDYIIDFFCVDRKLAIEIDGGHHKDPHQQKNDEERTQTLSKLGIQTIRFTNSEVEQNLDKVLREIKKHLAIV